MDSEQRISEMKDKVEKGFGKMIQNFEVQMKGLIDNSQEEFKKFCKQGEDDLTLMKNDHTDIHNRSIYHLKKANDDMLETASKAYYGIKESFKKNYEEIESKAVENFWNAINKYQENHKEIIKNVPSLPKKKSTDALRYLSQLQVQVLSELRENYFKFLKHMDSFYKEFINQNTYDEKTFFSLFQPKDLTSKDLLSRKSSHRAKKN